MIKFVTASVTGDLTVAGHNPNMERIGFNRHMLERPAPWNAVAVVFKTDGLVFIHLDFARNIRIKGMLRQS